MTTEVSKRESLASRSRLKSRRALALPSSIVMTIAITTAITPSAFASTQSQMAASKATKPGPPTSPAIASGGRIQIVKFPNQAQLPANFGDPHIPPLHPSSNQLKGIAASERALQSPKVQQDIRQAVRNLPHLSVGPNASAYETTSVDGFTIAEGIQNPSVGDPVSTFTASLNLYDAWGIHSATIYYHDVYYWNGSRVSAARPYWTYWQGWWTFLDSFSPGSASVANWGSESWSQGYCEFGISVTYGAIHWTFSGTAYMYANGGASGWIS